MKQSSTVNHALESNDSVHGRFYVFSHDSAFFWLMLTAVVVLLVLALGWNTPLNAPYIMDDEGSIHANSSIRSFTDGPSVWLPPGSGKTVQARPLLNITLACNYAWGRLDPAGYRIVNLVIHGSNALVLFGVMSLLLQSFQLPSRIRDQWGLLAAMTSILWICHPIGTNVVTYVVQRAESLATLWILLTVFLYLLANHLRNKGPDVRMPELQWNSPTGFLEKKSLPLLSGQSLHECFGLNCVTSGLLSASILTAIAACLSKETAIVIPLLIGSIDYAFFPGRIAEYYKELRNYVITLLIVIGASMCLIFSMAGSRNGTVGSGHYSGLEYLFGQGEIILRYVWGFLTADVRIFDFAQLPPMSIRGGICFAVLVVATAVALIEFPRRRSLVAWAVVAILIILGPTSSIIPVQSQVGIFHRFYLPSGILTALLAVVLFDILSHLRNGKMIFVVACVGVSIWWLNATYHRNQSYRDPLLIWRDSFDQWPWSGRAVAKLTRAAAKEGNWDEVNLINQRYIEAAESEADAKRNLAQVYAELGQLDRALAIASKLAVAYPEDPSVHNDLSRYKRDIGDLAGALSSIERALKLRENNPLFLVSRGEIYRRTGHNELVLRDFAAAIQFDDDEADTYFSLGSFWLDQNRFDRAEPCLRKAIELKANHHEAMYWLAFVLASRRDFIAAYQFISEALLFAESDSYLRLKESVVAAQSVISKS